MEYFETIKTLNGYGVQKVVTVNGRTQKLFVRRCFSQEEADIVAEKKNNELKNKIDYVSDKN